MAKLTGTISLLLAKVSAIHLSKSKAITLAQYPFSQLSTYQTGKRLHWYNIPSLSCPPIKQERDYIGTIPLLSAVHLSNRKEITLVQYPFSQLSTYQTGKRLHWHNTPSLSCSPIKQERDYIGTIPLLSAVHLSNRKEITLVQYPFSQLKSQLSSYQTGKRLHWHKHSS